MVVDVDESGGDDEPGYVDSTARGNSREIPDGRNPPPFEPNVGTPGGRAGAVDDASAMQHDIEGFGRACHHRKRE
jgi:hypothetical protein